jgi:succinate dehydrogenase/fumarate reductase flavoprotein subunit
MGMMFNSSNADLKHFFRATKSIVSFFYVARRLATHVKELALYRRGINVTSGNALAARLAKSALALDIPIHTSTPVEELLCEDGKVVGVRASAADGDLRITARHGVVLACGGFPHDLKRIAQVYPHVKRRGEHLSPTPVGNTGDGLSMAEKIGGAVALGFADASAWMPVSKVPFGKGRTGVFPHLLDRYKPGVIGVLRNGRRFTNESNSYHDVGAALMRACEGERETAMWLICDKVALGKWARCYAKATSSRARRSANWRVIAGLFLMRSRRRSLPTISTPCSEKTRRSSADARRSTVISPIRTTSPILALRRSRPAPSMR